MKVKIRQPQDWAESISVVVDGECNHAGAEEELIEIEWGIDDSREVMALVCRCEAYKIGSLYQDEDDQYIDYDDNEWLKAGN